MAVIAENFNLAANKLLDARTRKDSPSGPVCYTNVAEAKAICKTFITAPGQVKRVPGQILHILKDGIATPYWWRDGVEDEDLKEFIELKTINGVSISGSGDLEIDGVTLTRYQRVQLLGYANIQDWFPDGWTIETLTATQIVTAFHELRDEIIAGTVDTKDIYFPPMVYRLNNTLEMGVLSGATSINVFSQMTYAYDSSGNPGMKGAILFPNFNDRPIINIEYARNSSIRGMMFKGSGRLGESWSGSDYRYNTYCGISIDMHNASRTTLGEEDETYPNYTPHTNGKSSVIEISGCYFEDVSTCIVSDPTGGDEQGEFYTFSDNKGENIDWGISICNSQARNVTLERNQFNASKASYTNNRHGSKNGRISRILGGHHSGYAVLKIGNMAVNGPLIVDGGYSESIQIIGEAGNGGTNSGGVKFANYRFSFVHSETLKVPLNLLDGNSLVGVEFENCHIEGCCPFMNVQNLTWKGNNTMTFKGTEFLYGDYLSTYDPLWNNLKNIGFISCAGNKIVNGNNSYNQDNSEGGVYEASYRGGYGTDAYFYGYDGEGYGKTYHVTKTIPASTWFGSDASQPPTQVGTGLSFTFSLKPSHEFTWVGRPYIGPGTIIVHSSGATFLIINTGYTAILINGFSVDGNTGVVTFEFDLSELHLNTISIYNPYLGEANLIDAPLRVRSVTADYTVDENDNTILANASSGDVIVTLQKANHSNGKKFTVVKTDSSMNTVTVKGNGSELIGGSNTQVMYLQDDILEVQSISTKYIIR